MLGKLKVCVYIFINLMIFLFFFKKRNQCAVKQNFSVEYQVGSLVLNF